jgi:hypothetical protein
MNLFQYRPGFTGNEILFVTEEQFLKLQKVFDSCEDYEHRLYEWSIGEFSFLWRGTMRLFQVPPPLMIVCRFQNYCSFLSIFPTDNEQLAALEKVLNKQFPGGQVKKKRKVKSTVKEIKEFIEEARQALDFKGSESPNAKALRINDWLEVHKRKKISTDTIKRHCGWK